MVVKQIWKNGDTDIEQRHDESPLLPEPQKVIHLDDRFSTYSKKLMGKRIPLKKVSDLNHPSLNCHFFARNCKIFTDEDIKSSKTNMTKLVHVSVLLTVRLSS